MNIQNKLLLKLLHPYFEKNKKFKNFHRGDSCYIFGNGSSLKKMNFKKLNDKIAIGCNSLFLHSDFEHLNCLYYQMPAGFFYKYRKYYGKFQRNYLLDLYQEKMKQHKNITFFTNISNYPTLNGNNIHYVYHFGNRNWNLYQCEMDHIFSFMNGAFFAMLGTAIYMGFERVVLVGCDYTFAPIQNLHFFEKGPAKIGGDSPKAICEFLNGIKEVIDISTMGTIGLKSEIVNFIEYESHVNDLAKYSENTEIIAQRDLELLNKQGFYQIF